MLLSYHPLVVGDKVLISNGERIEDVHAFDLQTGRPLWPDVFGDGGHQRARTGSLAVARPRLGRALLRPGPQQRQGVARYTMTAAGGRLFVKLGTQATSLVPERAVRSAKPGYLVALDLETEKRRMFEIHLEPAVWGAGWAFEGAPLIDGENLYVSLRRRENLRTQSHVACFVMRRTGPNCCGDARGHRRIAGSRRIWMNTPTIC
jgi:cellulose synthase operon protein C